MQCFATEGWRLVVELWFLAAEMACFASGMSWFATGSSQPRIGWETKETANAKRALFQSIFYGRRAGKPVFRNSTFPRRASNTTSLNLLPFGGSKTLWRVEGKKSFPWSCVRQKMCWPLISGGCSCKRVRQELNFHCLVPDLTPLSHLQCDHSKNILSIQARKKSHWLC